MTIYSVLSTIEHNEHYLKRYCKFIENFRTQSKERFKTEYHHICPKSIFPEYSKLLDNNWNGVYLNSRQHFIAHWMLWKAYPESHSMFYAFRAMVKMTNKHQHRYVKLTSKIYQKLKEDEKSILSKRLKNIPKTEAHKQAMRKPKSYNPQIGRVEELVICPHCGVSGGKRTMKKWHFDNCKPVEINGIVYGSQQVAHIETGLSLYKIRKLTRYQVPAQ